MNRKIGLVEVEQYFKENGYPEYDADLRHGLIRKENAEFFVIASIRILKAHPGNKNFMPTWEHLFEYYLFIKYKK